MQPVLSIITEEIRKTIHFYEMDTHADAPTGIIVAGASASIPNIVQTIGEIINVEVSVANPFQSIQMDEESKRSMGPYAHIYAVAAGSAMRT
jgi:Tfp pilus assembly PilM family ATPase